MSFKGYGKIHALSKEECDNMLIGTCYIQEKIDGANLSVWFEEDRGICVGSRTQDITNASFRGAVEYIKSHKGIQKYLSDCPNDRLYGEWLVPHTITNYNPESYNHFYLFDIEDKDGERIDLLTVGMLADLNGIRFPTIFAKLENPTMEQIESFVGKSTIGPNGEGVVIKNFGFRNKFGDRIYGKIVGVAFKEQNNIVFGNSGSEDIEMKITFNSTSLERVRKIINKIEQNEDRDIQKSDINKIIGMVYYDVITEDLWDILKKVKRIDFSRLQKLCAQRTSRIAIDIIEGNQQSIILTNQ